MIPLPAPNVACLHGACPSAACKTLPMYTSSTASLGIPALFTASCIATVPNLGAGTDDKPPRKDPIGVLTALAITTSCKTNKEHFICESEE